MLTKEEYKKYIASLSDLPCGLENADTGTRTIKECNPPSENNRTCGICGKYLYNM